MKDEPASAENQCVFKSAPKIRIGEHRFEMSEADPRTEEDSFVEPKIFKGQRHAADRQIAEDKIPQ